LQDHFGFLGLGLHHYFGRHRDRSNDRGRFFLLFRSDLLLFRSIDLCGCWHPRLFVFVCFQSYLIKLLMIQIMC